MQKYSYDKLNFQINRVLFFAFLLYPVFYFCSGTISIHDVSPVKYIKYILISVFLAFNVTKQSLKGYISFFSVVSILLLTALLRYWVLGEYDIRSSTFYSLILGLTLLPFTGIDITYSFCSKVLFAMCIISPLFIFFEYFFLQGIIINFHIDGVYRCIGFFLNPNNAGYILCFFATCLVALICNKNSFSLYKNSLFIYLQLLVLAVAFTVSRSAMIYVLILFLYLFYQLRRQYRKLAAAGVVFLFTLLFFCFDIAGKGRDAAGISSLKRWEQIKECCYYLRNFTVFPDTSTLSDMMYIRLYFELSLFVAIAYGIFLLYLYFTAKNKLFPFCFIYFSCFLSTLTITPGIVFFIGYIIWRKRIHESFLQDTLPAPEAAAS